MYGQPASERNQSVETLYLGIFEGSVGEVSEKQLGMRNSQVGVKAVVLEKR